MSWSCKFIPAVGLGTRAPMEAVTRSETGDADVTSGIEVARVAFVVVWDSCPCPAATYSSSPPRPRPR